MQEQKSGTRLFLRQAKEDFLHTGAIAPSSRFLARAVTWSLRTMAHGINGGPPGSARHPLHVLEAGAGTGAVTREIVRCLPAGSKLDIYEINPVFTTHLERAFASGAVSVHNRRVEDVGAVPRFDAIVSGLPLNNFSAADVKNILEILFAALKPGGTLTWFEYLFIRELKSLATGSRERRRLRKVGRVTAGYLRRYAIRREAVFMNLPPALVHTLRKPP